MNTNDCLKELHAALVAKAKDRAAVDGNNKLALKISGKIAEYGAAWATAFGNDGKLDSEEARDLRARFNALVDAYLPSKDGILVDKAWNGFSVCFVTVFKGVRAYLNDWFGLGLKSLALVALLAFCGCKAFYENAGMHVRMGSLTAPVEFSEPSDSITVRALYGMDGIDMYAAKGCVATMSYTNVYSNSFAFGLFNWAGTQTGAAEIQPTVDEPSTNVVQTVDEPETNAVTDSTSAPSSSSGEALKAVAE